MKLRILFFLFIILFTKSFSQEVIIYDFQKQEFINPPKSLDENTTVKLKIENINLYLYAVNIIAKQNYFNKKIPDILNKVIQTQTENITPDYTSKLFSQKGDFVELFENKRLKSKKVPFLSENIIKSYKQLENTLNINTENILRTKDSKCYSCKIGAKPNFNFIVKRLKDNLEFLSQFEGIKVALDSNLIIPKNENELRIFNQIINFDIDKLSENLISGAILELNMTEENFNFISSPYSAKSNEIQLSAYISPLSTEIIPEIPLKKDSISISIPIRRNGIQITYSSGLFGAKNENENYSYSPIIKQTGELDYYKIEAEQLNNMNFGICANVHFLKQFSHKLSGGIHCGLGIPVEKKPNIYALIGPTVAFGVKNRMILNIGYAAGFANSISKTISLTQKFKDTAIPIVYNRILKGTFGASLTFNIYEK